MNIIRAFSSGVRRATAEPKMVVVLYVCNFLLALPIALAFHAALVAGFGSSMAPSSLMSGLDFTTWQDFMGAHGAELSALFGQMKWVIILSMLVNTFLAGGILSVLKDSRGGFTASRFFEGCGAYLLRFLRLFVLFAVVLLVVAMIAGVVMGILTDALTAHSTSEVTDFWVHIFTAFVVLIPMLLVLMIADYAKVGIVLNEETGVMKSAWKAVGFVFSHFFSTLGLEVLMLLVPILLFALYVFADLSIGMSSGVTMIIMVLIQQLFIAMKAWTRILIFEGNLTLYESTEHRGYANAGISPSYVTESTR
ncbi:MAG TPA: hypothetical protein VMH23_08680 [Bacteroidota bacterium]|nr:hypothetical protein [Bacteroidota bacterium]